MKHVYLACSVIDAKYARLGMLCIDVLKTTAAGTKLLPVGIIDLQLLCH